MNTVRASIVFLCVVFMLPFALVGISITLLGYPFAVLGSLFGDDDVMTIDEYREMITTLIW